MDSMKGLKRSHLNSPSTLKGELQILSRASFCWCFFLPSFHVLFYCHDSINSKYFKSFIKLWHHFINEKSTIFHSDGHLMMTNTHYSINTLSLKLSKPLTGLSMSCVVSELIKEHKVSTLLVGPTSYIIYQVCKVFCDGFYNFLV